MIPIIRKALAEDMVSVLKLIRELAEFEKEPHEVELNISDLKKAGFGKQPEFTCFVAEIENKIVGIAMVYYRFSSWKGTVLHLEDLIVSQVFQRFWYRHRTFKYRCEVW